MSTGATTAVFLSYASQDAEAARRICEALRSGGVEVWFDQNELVGGDAWDAKIRGQIKECALFVPLISANTQSRTEGYFRLEWRIADQRTHLMGRNKAFLLPVCVDQTPDTGADVPDSFLAVQWTRLAGGETPPAFCARVKKLLGGEGLSASPVGDPAPGQRPGLPSTALRRQSRLGPVVVGIAVVAALAAVFLWRPGRTPAPGPAASIASAPVSEARQLVAKARALALHDQLDEVTREEFSLAEQLLKRAVELDPLDGEAWAAAALCSCGQISLQYDSSQARRELALSQAEKARKLAPDSNAARFAWAMSYRFQESVDRAEVLRLHRDLAQREPDNKWVLRQVGRAFEVNGLNGSEGNEADRAEALRYYDRAAALPGGDAIALRLKADLLFGEGRYAESEETIDRALLLRPSAGHLYTSKIRNLIALDPDLTAAQRVLEKTPPGYLLDDQGAYVASWVWLWSRNPERSLAVLRGLTHDFMDSRYYRGPRAYLTGQAHQMAGRHEAAMTDWRIALQKVGQRLAAEPGSTPWRRWQAELLALLGDPAAADALQVYEQMAGISPPRVTGATVTTYLALGRREPVMDYIATRSQRQPDADFVGELRHSPDLDSLRGDPRFQSALVQAEAALAAREGVPTKAAATSAAPVNADDKSVAVLPFVNRSVDKENEFFTDGLHDDIVANLSKIAELRVISSASVAPYREAAKTPKQIGAELGVAYIVTGSVQRASNRVHLTAELVNARTDVAVAKTFDRDLNDIFAIQAELARAITADLKAVLSPGEQRSLEQAPTQNLAAYDLFLKGMTVPGGGRASYEGTARFMQAAVDLDPKFVEAWGWLLRCETFIYRNYDPSGTRLKRVNAIHDSLQQLAPGSTATILPFARYEFWVHGDFERAIAETRRYISLLPNDPEGYFLLEVIQYRQARLSDAIDNLRHSLALDPNNPGYHFNLLGPLEVCRRYEEEIAELQAIPKMLPDEPTVERRLAFAIFRGRGSTREGDAYFASLPADAASQPPAINDRMDWAEMTGNTAEFLRLEAQLKPDTGNRAVARALRVALARAASGDLAGARTLVAARWDEAQRLAEKSDNDPDAWRRAAEIAALLGRREDALHDVDTVSALPDTKLRLAQKQAADLVCRAFVSAWLGDKTAALDLYARLFQTPFSYLNVHEMKRRPDFLPLRDDPRFQALLADPRNNAPLF